MDNKLNNMIQQFIENNNIDNIDELNEKMQDFLEKYNNGEIEYENTPLDDAYEMLEEAEDVSRDRKERIDIAKKVYKKYPECFDALLLQVKLEDNFIQKLKLLNKGLIEEKKRLEKENYFDKENIGHFYGIFETRPYIGGHYMKADILLLTGKIKQGIEVCKEILRLNENDNTGARYKLMAAYAYLEEEKPALDLYKKYPEEDLEMLFPLFALYYKLGDEAKAKSYLNRINKANKHFIKYFKDTIKENEDVMSGYYQKGDSSEVLMYFETYSYLTDTMPLLDEFVLENSEKNSTKKKK